MMKLEDIRKNADLLNDIDWEMTPEMAVTLYLEWGNNPALGKNIVRSKNDFSTYFVINTWHEPVIYLVRRNIEDGIELATIKMPEGLKNRFLESVGHNKGVYSIEGEVKGWLKKKLYNA
ncbi:MAG: hypothetical protein KJ550_14010 [Proteobacteria bacterium]|nr:hypothetical protein [Pseudomonadota bacterium]MBU3980766.1 hypothetical protein [Pseudomonadota bacterium]MBU4014560.1 hypothetical protein [Pseudomonadota bacterium]MBU4068388.1 hypothetical protein [Pseudomonadota bacterium]